MSSAITPLRRRRGKSSRSLRLVGVAREVLEEIQPGSIRAGGELIKSPFQKSFDSNLNSGENCPFSADSEIL